MTRNPICIGPKLKLATTRDLITAVGFSGFRSWVVNNQLGGMLSEHDVLTKPGAAIATNYRGFRSHA